MLNLSISGNKISFGRAAANQKYQGTISGKVMQGTFTQNGQGKYNWKATKAN
jgi:hypothetical protein